MYYMEAFSFIFKMYQNRFRKKVLFYEGRKGLFYAGKNGLFYEGKKDLFCPIPYDIWY